MENKEIIFAAIEYIKNHIKSQNMSQVNVREKCLEKGYTISQGCISNMFNKPLSTTLSSLMIVCEGLDINIVGLFKNVYQSQTDQKTRFIYNIDDDAYDGYRNEFHIYFLPTSENSNMSQHHAILKLSDQYNMGECNAHIELDTGEKNDDGTPFIKIYEGRLVISKAHCAYISLLSEKYGDMCFLIFNHDYLNRKPLICTLANAVTASSGRIRYPTLHRVLISRVELDFNTLRYIRGFLRINPDENIVLSGENFNEFLSIEDFPETIKEQLVSLQKDSKPFYSLSKNALKDVLPKTEYSYIISRLLDYSIASKNNKVTEIDDNEVFQIIIDYINEHNLEL